MSKTIFYFVAIVFACTNKGPDPINIYKCDFGLHYLIYFCL